MEEQTNCPCHSQKIYSDCCQPYHQNALPKTALALMRSRYSAYALGLTDYIVQTTHPSNPNFKLSLEEWKKQIKQFSANTAFIGLEILEFIDDPEISYVTFKAELKQGWNDASFVEKSRFLKVKGRWLYVDGRIQA
jgi:SEC-C motif-containing protein